MKTVIIDGKDSYEDYGLVRKGVTVGAAPVRIVTVDVEGRDGALDLTEYFGEPLYDDRELEMTFTAAPTTDRNGVFRTFYNAIHGKRCKISLSEDAGIYYMGRCEVSDFDTSERDGEITVIATCEPYYYKAEPTTETFEVDGTTQKTFSNLRKTVIPTFTLSAAMTIKQGDSSYSASQGTWSDARLTFKQGDNPLTFTGTGAVTVTYQEGGL